MKSILKYLSKLIPDKADVFLLSGISFIFYGIYQIHIPSSFCITGGLLIGIGIVNSIPTKVKS